MAEETKGWGNLGWGGSEQCLENEGENLWQRNIIRMLKICWAPSSIKKIPNYKRSLCCAVEGICMYMMDYPPLGLENVIFSMEQNTCLAWHSIYMYIRKILHNLVLHIRVHVSIHQRTSLKYWWRNYDTEGRAILLNSFEILAKYCIYIEKRRFTWHI